MFDREMFRRRRGFALILTLILMTTLSAVMGGLIISLTHDYRAAFVRANDAKAFWLAEGAMADMVKRLKNDEINLDDGDISTVGSQASQVSFGDGGYWASLSRSGDDITVTVNGEVNSQARQLQAVFTESIVIPPAFNHAVFGSNANGKTLNIGNNNAATVAISGDLFYNATAGTDTVDVTNNSKITGGFVYADVVTGGGTYTQSISDPSPIPTYPPFTTTTYDNHISDAEANSAGNLTLSGNDDLDLNNGVVYYDRVTVRNNATITGPGTLVATRDITFKNSAAIGANVTVISKRGILVDGSATIASGGKVYARNDITLKGNTAVTSSLFTPNSNKKVEVQGDATFTGIIYADTVTLKNNANVTGSVVANKFTQNQIANNARVTYDANSVPTVQTLPDGLSPVEVYIQKADSWQEV